MTGSVNGELEAVIGLRLRGPHGELEAQAVIDTGFTDYLLVPHEILEELGTIASRETEVVLGDGSEVRFDLHLVDVLWNGEWLTVRAFAGGNAPLVGVSLLAACDLRVRFLPGGEVRVEAV